MEGTVAGAVAGAAVAAIALLTGQVNSPSPAAKMLPPLTRLVHGVGGCSLPSRDWFLVQMDAPSPRAI
eukprot:51364-Prorocentrum_minimum.AAC.1